METVEEVESREESETLQENDQAFFVEKDEAVRIITRLSNSSNNKECEDDYVAVYRILDKYQEQSQLIGPALPELMAPINNFLVLYITSSVGPNNEPADIHFHLVSKLVYCISKVIGYKTSAKQLPHEVSLFAPVLAVLDRAVRLFELILL